MLTVNVHECTVQYSALAASGLPGTTKFGGAKTLGYFSGVAGALKKLLKAAPRVAAPATSRERKQKLGGAIFQKKNRPPTKKHHKQVRKAPTKARTGWTRSKQEQL
jgi:hypothetical protein